MGSLKTGECVRVPDGRPGRVRAHRAGKFSVRVRRKGKSTDELLTFAAADLRRIEPPTGWMSAEGYNRRVAALRRRSKER
ncbi:MAG: hypothetical protein ABJC61_13690 [Acidobacteriota bacterium]